jgi:hypothetical protein
MNSTRIHKEATFPARFYYGYPQKQDSIYGVVDATQAMKILATYHMFRTGGRPARLFITHVKDSGNYGCKSQLAIEEVSKAKLFAKSIAKKSKLRRVAFPASFYGGGEFYTIHFLEEVLSEISTIRNEKLMRGAVSGIKTLKASLDKKPKKWGGYSDRLQEVENRIERQISFSR